MLTSLRAQLQSHHRRYSLRWHLGGLLLIKAMVLYIIWLAWFSHPVSLKPRQVADVLLTSSPVSSCSRKEPCDATQP
jgi:hypothetical protein